MNVRDLPRPVDPALYEEAAARYCAAVRARAISVYRVDGPPYPGLPGLELLVVVHEKFVDNRYYFSAFGRLPEKYAAALVHEPYIVPGTTLNAVRHAPRHARLDVLHGRNILSRYTVSDEPAERWCRFLGAYCEHAAFVARVSASGTLPGREAVIAAAALRLALDESDLLLGTCLALPYANALEALCERFFQRGDPERNVLEIWGVYAKFVAALDRGVRSLFALAAHDDAIRAASDYARGERECREFDRAYAFRRARAVDGYYADLASLGFPYGSLFFAAAHPQAMRDPYETPFVMNIVRGAYRARRRIEEYAVSR